MPDPIVIEDFPPQPAITDGRGPRRARAFWVTAGSQLEAEQRLETETGVRRGAIYQDHAGNIEDIWLRCLTIEGEPLTPVPATGTGLYHVRAYYGYPSFAGAQRPPAVPDLSVRIWIETAEESVLVDRDRFGNPITNAADEPVDPPLTKLLDRETLVLEWSKFATDWLSVYLPKRKYRKKLNVNTYFGAEPFTLLCRDIRVTEGSVRDTSGLFKLFTTQARLDYRAILRRSGDTIFSSWDDTFPNWGRRVKNTGPDAATRPYRQLHEHYLHSDATERDKGPLLQDPVFLNEAGTAALNQGVPPNYRVAQHYDSISFENLVS